MLSLATTEVLAVAVGDNDLVGISVGDTEVWSSTTFVIDSLSGTPSAALPDPPWDTHSAGTAAVVYNGAGNRLRMGATGTAIRLHETVPPSADYTVGVDIRSLSVASINITAGVVARFDPSANTGYIAEHIATTSGTVRRWRLRRVNAGVATDLGTPIDTSFVGATKRAELVVDGADIALLIDGVVSITATDSSPILTAGRCGIKLSNSNTVNDTNGSQLSNFRGAT